MSNIEGTVPCCDAKSSLPCGDAECCTGNGITGRTGKYWRRALLPDGCKGRTRHSIFPQFHITFTLSKPRCKQPLPRVAVGASVHSYLEVLVAKSSNALNSCCWRRGVER